MTDLPPTYDQGGVVRAGSLLSRGLLDRPPCSFPPLDTLSLCPNLEVFGCNDASPWSLSARGRVVEESTDSSSSSKPAGSSQSVCFPSRANSSSGLGARICPLRPFRHSPALLTLQARVSVCQSVRVDCCSSSLPTCTSVAVPLQQPSRRRARRRLPSLPALLQSSCEPPATAKA